MSLFDEKCLSIRKEIIDIFSKGKRGHIPSAFSLVEILVTLYYYKYKLNVDNFKAKDRTRVVLSKGHGCLALYAVLGDLGFFSKKEYEKFCQLGGILGGHPSRSKVPGIEFSSGSLGHGLSFATGVALNYKKNKFKNKIITILGDGECNEGSVWEAALSIGKYQLDNLIVIVDYNKFQSYGPISEVSKLEPFADKWKSFGFKVFDVDMVKKPEQLLELLNEVQDCPLVFICHTIKGQGHKGLETDTSWHHKSNVSEEDIKFLISGLK